MTLTRTIGVLGGVLALLLLAVVLRGETARVHYEVSRLDREIDGLVQQVRESGLEIARLRNPALILRSAEALRMARSPERRSDPRPAATSGGR